MATSLACAEAYSARDVDSLRGAILAASESTARRTTGIAGGALPGEPKRAGIPVGRYFLAGGIAGGGGAGVGGGADGASAFHVSRM
jgi:hypothetical protein